jgi:hypothetical protein
MSARMLFTMSCGEEWWLPGSCVRALWTGMVIGKMLYACTVERSGGSKNIVCTNCGETAPRMLYSCTVERNGGCQNGTCTHCREE